MPRSLREQLPSFQTHTCHFKYFPEASHVKGFVTFWEIWKIKNTQKPWRAQLGLAGAGAVAIKEGTERAISGKDQARVLWAMSSEAHRFLALATDETR